jgi:hypothetical protein
MSALLSCPKFSRCNASICPLDGEWDRRKMLDDEPFASTSSNTQKRVVRPDLRSGDLGNSMR